MPTTGEVMLETDNAIQLEETADYETSGQVTRYNRGVSVSGKMTTFEIHWVRNLSTHGPRYRSGGISSPPTRYTKYILTCAWKCSTQVALPHQINFYMSNMRGSGPLVHGTIPLSISSAATTTQRNRGVTRFCGGPAFEHSFTFTDK